MDGAGDFVGALDGSSDGKMEPEGTELGVVDGAAESVGRSDGVKDGNIEIDGCDEAGRLSCNWNKGIIW